jgi:hypothetical protein
MIETLDIDKSDFSAQDGRVIEVASSFIRLQARVILPGAEKISLLVAPV